METENTLIIEKAAKIILNSGLQELTIQNLATELQVKKSLLSKKLTTNDAIILMLFLSFESDINELILEFEQTAETPENELKILFNELYSLFLHKPYYLDIIFDKNLNERDESIKKSMLRIQNRAENYLTALINKGKEENTFKTKIPTKSLVRKMLSGFRLFIKDEQRIHEMLLEMKSLQTLND